MYAFIKHMPTCYSFQDIVLRALAPNWLTYRIFDNLLVFSLSLSWSFKDRSKQVMSSGGVKNISFDKAPLLMESELRYNNLNELTMTPNHTFSNFDSTDMTADAPRALVVCKKRFSNELPLTCCSVSCQLWTKSLFFKKKFRFHVHQVPLV